MRIIRSIIPLYQYAYAEAASIRLFTRTHTHTHTPYQYTEKASVCIHARTHTHTPTPRRNRMHARNDCMSMASPRLDHSADTHKLQRKHTHNAHAPFKSKRKRRHEHDRTLKSKEHKSHAFKRIHYHRRWAYETASVRFEPINSVFIYFQIFRVCYISLFL